MPQHFSEKKQSYDGINKGANGDTVLIRHRKSVGGIPKGERVTVCKQEKRGIQYGQANGNRYDFYIFGAGKRLIERVGRMIQAENVVYPGLIHQVQVVVDKFGRQVQIIGKNIPGKHTLWRVDKKAFYADKNKQ